MKKVIQVSKTNFKLNDGTEYPIEPPLEKLISKEEMQKIHEKSAKIIRSLGPSGSNPSDSSELG